MINLINQTTLKQGNSNNNKYEISFLSEANSILEVAERCREFERNQPLI